MASEDELRKVFEDSLDAGYPPAQVKARMLAYKDTGKVPTDPTEAVWPNLIHQESRGKQGAVSPKGAVGVAQVMPGTAPEAAKMAGVPYDENLYKHDSKYNAAIGRAYLRKQFEDFGDPQTALAAYNAGPGAVRKAGGDLSKLPQETQNYVPAIMSKSNMGNQDMDSPADAAAAQQALQPSPEQKARMIFEQMSDKGASPDEIKAALRQAMGVPAPQAAPQAPPQPVPQPSAAPAPVQQDPAQAQPPGTVAVPRQAGIVDRLQQLMGDGSSNWDKFQGGVERNVTGMDRGVKKIIGQLTGNTDLVKRMEAEEQGVRDVYNRNDPVGSGPSMSDAGRVAADTLGFAAPGAVAAKALGPIAGGALVGAAQGGITPTTADDSQLTNTALGAGVGAGVGALGKALTALVGKINPAKAAAVENMNSQGVKVPEGRSYDSSLADALRKMSGRDGTTPQLDKSLTSRVADVVGLKGTDITNETLEGKLRDTGKAISDAYKGTSAPLTSNFAQALRDVKKQYLLSGAAPTDQVVKKLDYLRGLYTSGKPVSGEQYQALRGSITGQTVSGNAAQKGAYQGMKTALDDAFSGVKTNGTEPIGDLRSQYRMAKILRSGKGVPAEGLSSSQVRNKIEAAATKGGVSPDFRSLLSDASDIAPTAKIGGEAATAGSDSGAVQKGLESRSTGGLIMALVQALASPASKAMDSGVPGAVTNSPVTRTTLSNLLRNLGIQQGARIKQGEQ